MINLWHAMWVKIARCSAFKKDEYKLELNNSFIVESPLNILIYFIQCHKSLGYFSNSFSMDNTFANFEISNMTPNT